MSTKIALAGNPNCGKTTMFNDLTGSNQYVGNWPGVTVEKKEGKYTRDKDVIITDLPGVYSLSPYSPEEIVTRDYLLDGGPDVVVNLVDATNLERNLYLTTQILDLGVPVVVALNMMDLVKKSGDKIDVAGLSKQLGCPIVETTALKGHGMAELMETAVKAAKAGKPAEPKMPFDAQVEEAITKIEGILGNRVSPATARWFAIKLFEGEERTVANMKLSAADLKAVEAIREEVENKLDDDAESIITSERYNAITHVIDKTMKRSHKGMTTTQKIDRVVTNRWLGLPIFVVVMALVYYLAISVGTGVVTDWANDGISGDGFLYTGGAAYEEAVGEWEGEQANIEAYLAAAEEDGIDVEGATAALEAEEPTAADESALAAFQEDAEKAGVVGIVEDEETGESAEVDAAAFATALEAEEPDASDGSWGLWIPGLGAVIGNALEAVDVAPWLQSLVMDGIVAGVGAVIGFIPQMIILFLLLALLEGCGYLARVAFIMDRVFRRFGLSGKSFIPMLVASGCGVPAVTATKTIENEKDRRMTIMTTTMIPCGAKMPIIALVFGAIAGGNTEATWLSLIHIFGVVGGQDVAEVARGHAYVQLVAQVQFAVGRQLRVGRHVVHDLGHEAPPVDGVRAGKSDAVLVLQLLRKGLVAEHVFRARLAVVEVSAHAPYLHVAPALRGHLLELDVAHAAVGVHDADGHAVHVAEALERGFARVSRGGYQDEEVVVELALLAQLGGACGEETRQALQRHVLERARGAVP